MNNFEEQQISGRWNHQRMSIVSMRGNYPKHAVPIDTINDLLVVFSYDSFYIFIAHIVTSDAYFKLIGKIFQLPLEFTSFIGL